MTQSQHTPLPWKVYYAKNNGQTVLGTGEENGCAIQSHSGGFWRDDEEAKANAEFVVKACNSHYELLEALETLIALRETPYSEDEKLAHYAAMVETHMKAKQIIEKAKG